MGVALSREDMYTCEAVLNAEDIIEDLGKQDPKIEAKVVGSLENVVFDLDYDGEIEFTNESDIDIAVYPHQFHQAMLFFRERFEAIPIPTFDYYRDGDFKECKIVDQRYGGEKFTIHLIGSLGIL